MLNITATRQAIKKRFKRKKSPAAPPVDCDVLIVGAGLAGIGMACQLQQRKSKKKVSKQAKTPPFIVLEKRSDLGGTWDLFTYPGIRSDSDALTFGYSFRPWLDHRMLAAGEDIKSYIADTAREFGITEHIRYQHEVQQLSWSAMINSGQPRSKIM